MIRSHTQGPVAVIRLSRPERRNALTLAGMRALRDAVRDSGSRADARVLLIEGEGDTFCAGFDLDECRAEPGGSVMRSFLALLSETIGLLRALDTPVVIAAHGAAVAGGCALLSAADLVITNDAARLGYPVVRLGVSPAVSSPFVARAVGPGATRSLQLDPGLIGGREAVRLGMAYESLPDAAGVRPRALELAEQLAAKPAHALAATRSWLRELESLTPEEAGAALDASAALAGGEEERALLAGAGGKR